MYIPKYKATETVNTCTYFSLSPLELAERGEWLEWGRISSGIGGGGPPLPDVIGWGRALFLGLPGLYCTYKLTRN